MFQLEIFITFVHKKVPAKEKVTGSQGLPHILLPWIMIWPWSPFEEFLSQEIHFFLNDGFPNLAQITFFRSLYYQL